ncbi:hypothetical protein M3202_19705 [Alkalihalobacillus oceani]|uniref:Uncharacterized protein n=1 Tax=Halalkalibacter oceani TaxID=1653776 RepID=A0A9X2IS83_9BACI|nr:hypothetical protein [Halalkalibacter oceani]MCM3716273.1 hypothetical protein [Halalkalibacter oceani]
MIILVLSEECKQTLSVHVRLKGDQLMLFTVPPEGWSERQQEAIKYEIENEGASAVIIGADVPLLKKNLYRAQYAAPTLAPKVYEI